MLLFLSTKFIEQFLVGLSLDFMVETTIYKTMSCVLAPQSLRFIVYVHVYRVIYGNADIIII